MKKVLSLVLAILMVATCMMAFSACNNNETDSKTIKIGLIGPFTGAVAVYGTSVQKGVRMAVEEINASSTLLNGYTIELVEKDDMGDATTGAAAFNDFVDAGVQAVIGPVTTGVTAAATSIANENGIVLITPSATGDKITTSSDYVFRSCYKDSFQGIMAARYAVNELGYTAANIGCIYATGDDYSKGVFEAFKAECERLGVTLRAEAIQTSQTIDKEETFAPQLTALTTAIGADGFLFAPYYYEAVGTKLVPQARAAGFNGKIMGVDGYDGMIDYATGDLTDYNDVLFTNHYSAESTEEKVVNFISTYTTKFGENPTAFSALAYDAMYMLANALEKALADDADASKLTGAIIKAKLDGCSVQGVTGSFTLDTTGTPVKDVVIMEYKLNAETNKVEMKYVKTLKNAEA